MKRLGVMVALMVSASVCNAWGTVGILPNRDGGAIHLTDRPCNDNTSTYGMAYATGKAKDLKGCWTLNDDGDVAVHWQPKGFDDFWKVYDRSHFDVTAYGRANGWD